MKLSSCSFCGFEIRVDELCYWCWQWESLEVFQGWKTTTYKNLPASVRLEQLSSVNVYGTALQRTYAHWRSSHSSLNDPTMWFGFPLLILFKPKRKLIGTRSSSRLGLKLILWLLLPFIYSPKTIVIMLAAPRVIYSSDYGTSHFHRCCPTFKCALRGSPRVMPFEWNHIFKVVNVAGKKESARGAKNFLQDSRWGWKG